MKALTRWGKAKVAIYGFLCLLAPAIAVAGGNELAYYKLNQLTTLAPTAVASGDYLAVYDATTGTVKKLDAQVLPLNTAASLVESVTTTNVIAATECGTTYILNLAGGFTSTLPAPTAGCKFKFIVGTAPTTAYILASNGGADVIYVHVNELETDTGDDGPYDDNADAVNFTANVADPGDWLECVSDGTSWFCTGQVQNDGALTSSTN